MRVAIAGGHGQIALRLAKVLSQRGDEVVALIRNPDHADEVREAGAEPSVVDLEHASEDDVAVLRERVTSKGGTTERALASLREDRVVEAIAKAIRAANARARELGDELGRDS